MTPPKDNPESDAADVLVELYRKRFDYLDSNEADNLLTYQELASAYSDFDWPKENLESNSDIDYAKKMIERYDTDKNQGLGFVEFVKFQEDMWEISDKNSERKCATGYDKSIEVWDGLFKWLDRDNDQMLKVEDLIFGISKIMYTDVDKDEVKNVFTTYAAKDGKLNYENFVLAIANGFLDKTLGGI